MLGAGQYPEAREAFLALGDYGDAATQAKQAVYLPALAAMENQDYDTALALWQEIPDYEDAATQIQASWYGKGQQLLAAGSPLEAGEAFRNAGDYPGAGDMVGVCLYQAAEDAYGRTDYATAITYYDMMPDTYEDVAAKRNACRYDWAKSSLKDKEYIQATSLLAQLPDDYEDVTTLRMEVIYREGGDLLKQKNWQAALDKFLQIPAYEDAQSQIKAARYGLAATLVNEKNWVSAIAQYEELGEYKSSARNLRSARYNYALSLFQEGKWAEAKTQFVLLEDYKDAADKAQECDYKTALAVENAGDYAAAKALYQALGRYGDCATRIKACDYGIAANLEATGETEASAALFLTLGDYSDAAQRGYGLYYALGAAAQENGQVLVAARYYQLAGKYSDAAQKADACYDSYYGEASAQAHDAYDNGEFAQAATLLTHMDLTDLPTRYKNLATLYQLANYREGKRLYDLGYPFEALPWFEAVPGYEDVDRYLNSAPYLIEGTWTTEDGVLFLFRRDGSCAMAGQELLYRVQGNQVKTATEAEEELTFTHRIGELKGNKLVLQDMQGKTPVTYWLTKVEDGTAHLPENKPTDGLERPVPTASPAPMQATVEATATDLPDMATPTDSFVVIDDE